MTLWGFNSSAPILGGMMGSSAIAAEGAGQKAYGIEEALIERGFTVNPDMMAFCADSSMDQYRMQSMLFGQVSYGHALSVAFDTVVDALDTYFVGEAQVSLYEDQVLGAGNATDAIGSSTGGAWNYADEVSYPFGYGLSYTTFERKLEDVQLEVGGTGTAKVTVTNTGDAAGKCAVQLYVQAPYTAGGVEKAAIQLLAFGKTDILAPGASQTLEIEFDPTYMASYDETAVKADGTTGAWSLEAGDYYFAVGNGAHEALNSVLAKKLGTEEGLLTVNESEIIDAENAFLWTLDAADIETYSAGVQNVLQEGSDDFDGIDSVGFPTVPNHDGPVGFAYDQISGYTAHWAETDSAAPTYVSQDDPYANYSMAVFPTEPMVAATFNKELVEREGELYGEDSLWAKAPVSFSPAINLHRTPYCARNHEYYSEDPMLTNLLAVAVCKGATAKGLMMEVKHLAFNHQEMKRVGVSTFLTEQAGREGDLRGFQGACSGNWTKGVMTAYNRVGDVYTGGSKALQTDILRNEWGYTGWIVTDMAVPPEYMNWREAVYGGGCTVLTSTATFAQGQIGTMESNREAILADTAFQQNMKSGIKHYLYTFAASNAMNGITANTERVYVRTWWQNALRAVEIGLGVLTALCVILLFVTKRERRAAK